VLKTDNEAKQEDLKKQEEHK